MRSFGSLVVIIPITQTQVVFDPKFCKEVLMSPRKMGLGLCTLGTLPLGPILSCCGQLHSFPEALRRILSITQVSSAGRSHLIVPGRAQHNLGLERLTLMSS